VRRNRNPRGKKKKPPSQPPNVDANATVSASAVQGLASCHVWQRDGQILVGSVPGFFIGSKMRHTFRSRRRQAGGERNFEKVFFFFQRNGQDCVKGGRLPPALCRGLCAPLQGRDDQHWFRRVGLESSVHNWPNVESAEEEEEERAVSHVCPR
jgi:hypothetical protein